ncbi:MAG: preprotein translocase subunit SecE [Bdellovibrionota bacterium]
MKNSKVVNIFFVGAGALLWFLSLHYITQWVGYFQLARHLGSEASDLIRHGLPILLGVSLFVFLRSWTKASHFVSDCVDELFRVVFPGPKEVKAGTTWVIIIVILAGLAFGALDWGITHVIKRLIGLES